MPFFVFLQGIGNILVGPLSAALLAGPIARQDFGTGKYSGIIILAGASSLLAALLITLWYAYSGLRHSR